MKVEYSWGSDLYAPAPEHPNTPASVLTPTPTPEPTPPTSPTPTPQPSVQTVKTWVGKFDPNWSSAPNWDPFGVPTGDELIVIKERLPLSELPIVDIDFTLTAGAINIGPAKAILEIADGITFVNNGTINIGPADSALKLAEGATFINNGTMKIGPANSTLNVAQGAILANHGTIDAEGDLLNEGTTVNNGDYNNGAMIFTSGPSASFANNLGGVLNNAAGGSSSGLITNACGETVNDSGTLDAVLPAACLWSGSGSNDNWSNPVNWANGLVPPENHPVAINKEGSSNARVVLDVDLSLQSRSLTVEPGDTLTIGSGAIDDTVTLRVKEPGGLLVNRGTVAISNYSSLLVDPLATISNVGGNVRNACRGTAPFGRVMGAEVVQDACFWDGEGETNNWSEAANWDSDTVPTSNDPVLIGNLTNPVSGVTLDSSFDLNSLGILTIEAGQTLNVGQGITLRIASQPPGGSIWIKGVLNLNGGTLHSHDTGLINNHGTINVNGGTLLNQGDFLVNEADGQINNVGGLISNGAGATFTNSGTLVNDAESTFLHGDDATLINTGAFTNAGMFYASSRGGITNRKGGTLVNIGTLNQRLGQFFQPARFAYNQRRAH